MCSATYPTVGDILPRVLFRIVFRASGCWRTPSIVVA
jgi:hypothetical protein